MRPVEKPISPVFVAVNSPGLSEWFLAPLIQPVKRHSRMPAVVAEPIGGATPDVLAAG